MFFSFWFQMKQYGHGIKEWRILSDNERFLILISRYCCNSRAWLNPREYSFIFKLTLSYEIRRAQLVSYEPLSLPAEGLSFTSELYITLL